MGLKALNLKSAYYSDEDNLLLDFYVPVLSKSISYKRIAGYFSSNSLAVAAKGISKFISNGGRVKLIANVVLSEEDQTAIKEAISKKETEIIQEIYALEDELKKNHIRMLGWMIKNNSLEIKIAVVRRGVEHQKIGILNDSEGNTISFSGSDNETAYGWLHNDEQFHVFCSWKEGDGEHLLSDSERFDRLWENRGNKVRVFDVSEAFKNGLVKSAPRDNEEFNNLSARTIDALIEENNRICGQIKIKEKPLSFIDNLWYFQKDAIDNWERNDFKGIFSMATGTGKTKTAIGGIIKLKNLKARLFAVISSPQNTILKQWENEIKAIGLFNASIIADSTNSLWNTQLADKVIDYNEGNINSCIVFTTYNTLSGDNFINLISNLSGPSLLVGDEVHWAGASTFRKGLAQTYEFRLGLSATPKRYMDEEGTGEIINYFGDAVYEFSLERALTEINPITKETFLCPYNYYPLFINLNEDELSGYYELTEKINRQFAKESKYEFNSDYFQRLCEKRQAVIVNAIGKYEVLNNLLNSLEIIKFLLIYCSPEQIDTVQAILNTKGIINHRFTGQEGTSPRKEYNGKSERDFILHNFEQGAYKALVAMRCLDEGVNIERAEYAILMASSGNSKEYIQRRGRLLRRHKDKSISNIFDIIVVPYLDKERAMKATRDDLKILSKEFKRYEEFANLAENKLEALTAIFDIKELYNFYTEA